MRSTKILRTLGIIGSILFVFAALIIPSIIMGHIHFDPSGLPIGIATFGFSGITDASLNTMGEEADGEENMGGYGMVCYLALRSHLDTYPTLTTSTSATTLEALCKLNGSYGFLTGKNFIPINVAPESLFVDPVSQGGSPGTNSFNLSGGFIINGMKGKHRGTARILNNCYGVIIIPNEDGTRTAYGDYLRPVKFTIKGSSGKAAKDAKHFEYSFVTDSFVPGYTYEGDIVLDASTLPSIS
jgi:hypothetical protein